jgi:hypothetical protein
MLQKNPLAPPRPLRTGHAPAGRYGQPAGPTSARFVSADDFDRTGILAGLDPCESSYWWMPELGSASGPDDHVRHGADDAA